MEEAEIRSLKNLEKLPYFAVYNVLLLCIMRTHFFGPNFQGKKTCFNILIQVLICLRLDTCFFFFCIIKEF